LLEQWPAARTIADAQARSEPDPSSLFPH
jgi:hypothetical protein